LVVDLLAVCVYFEGGHDLLLFSVCAGDIELDLLGGAVEFDVELVDFDVGVASGARAVAVCLEDVIGQDAQRRRGEE
jgi:hypothetical protein